MGLDRKTVTAGLCRPARAPGKRERETQVGPAPEKKKVSVRGD